MADMRNTETANRIARVAMENAHSTCNSIYTRIDSARDQLRPSWQGDASTVYQEAMVQWLEELRLITNDMSAKIGEWGGTTRAMHTTEDSNLQLSSSWMGQLNPNQPSQA
ncbi:hypothetical protein LG943_25525 [Streptomonospora sp. S1-112]|uniref:ESAT-6-like protein n=2 Tax=Streptomonospora mangrovi TaxID=2883123 RepID=A0A9X3SH82_9ACTN|nr:hypothetical protein [Streptomonospora mangrovi]MDA0567657.1 hypothetical protein [Streptomonospora mangrovi]